MQGGLNTQKWEKEQKQKNMYVEFQGNKKFS